MEAAQSWLHGKRKKKVFNYRLPKMKSAKISADDLLNSCSLMFESFLAAKRAFGGFLGIDI